jgi:hypothetical protein
MKYFVNVMNTPNMEVGIINLEKSERYSTTS